jgi:hypothetical protein
MDAAMRPAEGRLPDRAPVMCQLALGHYFLHAGDPIDIWHDTDAFAEALLTLRRRYRFDGILVNLPGRDPNWRRFVRSIDADSRGRLIRWTDGRCTLAPPDDNPHVWTDGSGRRLALRMEDIDPDRLFYVEPHDLAGPTHPTAWGFHAEPAVPGPDFFPPWHWDTITRVRASAPEVSVHGEVFSPLSQLMELVGHMSVLGALLLDPAKVLACLDRLTEGAIVLAKGQIAAGADAVLISSAFAGAGFLSPDHYRRFVLPFEKRIIAAVRCGAPGIPVYTHTCGAIGDRLELMVESGTSGIDTLDPPPLGTVDLADAKARLGGRVFIKGNVDPVNTVLHGTPEACYRDACTRLAIGGPGGGYILSTACSVPPHAPPENILALTAAAEQAGGERG